MPDGRVPPLNELARTYLGESAYLMAEVYARHTVATRITQVLRRYMPASLPHRYAQTDLIAWHTHKALGALQHAAGQVEFLSGERVPALTPQRQALVDGVRVMLEAGAHDAVPHPRVMADWATAISPGICAWMLRSADRLNAGAEDLMEFGGERYDVLRRPHDHSVIGLANVLVAADGLRKIIAPNGVASMGLTGAMDHQVVGDLRFDGPWHPQHALAAHEALRRYEGGPPTRVADSERARVWTGAWTKAGVRVPPFFRHHHASEGTSRHGPTPPPR